MEADYYHAHNFYVGWIVLLSSILHRGKFIYDIHEIIWDESELIYKVGLTVDKILLPHSSLVICPSEDRARLISEHYRLKKFPLALYNYPRFENSAPSTTQNFFKNELSLHNENRILCYTGMFSVKTRLQDNVIKALPYIPEQVIFVLIGFGHPNEINVLEETAKKYNVSKRVFILAPKPHSVLMQYTRCCDIGISLLKNLGIAYRYHALNKFYEYASSGLAVLASNFPTFNHDIYENPVGKIGSTCNEEDPLSIAESICDLIADESRLSLFKGNSLEVFKKYWNWEMQEGKLLQAYERM
jgi:glycosyltransferase involved in cell wall biosynthesis